VGVQEPREQHEEAADLHERRRLVERRLVEDELVAVVEAGCLIATINGIARSAATRKVPCPCRNDTPSTTTAATSASPAARLRR
jgi:hypothetical protein